MTVDTHKETLGFQAEVKQLLDIMIHSLLFLMTHSMRATPTSKYGSPTIKMRVPSASPTTASA